MRQDIKTIITPIILDIVINELYISLHFFSSLEPILFANIIANTIDITPMFPII